MSLDNWEEIWQNLESSEEFQAWIRDNLPELTKKSQVFTLNKSSDSSEKVQTWIRNSLLENSNKYQVVTLNKLSDSSEKFETWIRNKLLENSKKPLVITLNQSSDSSEKFETLIRKKLLKNGNKSLVITLNQSSDSSEKFETLIWKKLSNITTKYFVLVVDNFSGLSEEKFNELPKSLKYFKLPKSDLTNQLESSEYSEDEKNQAILNSPKNLSESSEELKKHYENQKSSLLDETKPLEDFSLPDFEHSALWSFHYCLLLLEKLLNERQREEWIGDLEEVLYKMHELKCPKWRFHIEVLRRTFDFLKGVFIIKLNALPYKRKSSK